MALTQYAGDRFVAATTDIKPTGVLPGAFLTVSGDGSRANYIKTGYTHEAWVAIGGGGGSPGGSNTQVQFNNNGVFGATTGLTFDGQRLFANNLQVSGIIYDSNVSVGENGMVLTNEGQTGIHWKNIESVLSGVGGSGVANYVARWSDEDTLTSGTIYDDGDVGIGTTNPAHHLHVDGDAIISGKLYDTTNSTGNKGYVLTSDDAGPVWAASGDFDTLSGNLIATGAIVDDISGNLITTGQTLTSEINTVSGDLISTGVIIDDVSGNLITTGQTLTTEINTVSNNLISTGAIVDDISGNLITTGQTLTTNLTATGAIVDDISGNLTGITDYVPRWLDVDTLTTGLLYDNATNVGIGTIDPQRFLHVAGDAIISGVLYDSTNSSGVAGHVFTSEAGGPQWKMIEDVLSGVGGNGTANYIPKWEDSDTIGNSVMYDDGSNIGIGTDDPQAPLHVLQTTGDNNDTGLIVETTNTAERARIVLRQGNAEDYILQSNYYGFHIGATSKLEVINIERVTNHIGIGEDQPTCLFDIRDWGGNVDTRMHLMNTSQTSNGRVTDILFGKDNANNLIGQLKYYYHTTQASRRIELNHLGENGQLTILDGGNVGIGTTDPASPLTIKSNSNSSEGSGLTIQA
ncbi:MAG: hypothetical protein QF535_20610, partial [Anaerolineales bacterium]|nr:hypothetical protein [Anaerolineales bacterium]